MAKPILKTPNDQKPYKRFWTHYVDFKGTSTRKQYWVPTLLNILISIIIMAVGVVLFLIVFKQNGAIFRTLMSCILVSTVATILFGLAIWIPSITNAVRRFHDIGISGWWYLLFYLIPMTISVADPELKKVSSSIVLSVIALVEFVLLLLPSKTANNKYRK